jgi:hypothetical protein
MPVAPRPAMMPARLVAPPTPNRTLRPASSLAMYEHSVPAGSGV